MIRLRILGSIDLQSADDRPLPSVVSQPKRLALLAHLAVARPSGFRRRDRLLAMFWPDQDDGHARDSLNQAIRFLRQTLGSNVILSRGAEDVGIDPAQIWCDATELSIAVDEGRPRDAMELYRGDLLDGFFVAETRGFDEWLEGERTVLRERAAQAARVLAEQEERAANLTQALHWGRLAVSLANGDERAFRRWLSMLARAGDRAGAVKAYDEFAGRLRNEYDADPSPETQALADEIRRDIPKQSVVSPSGILAPPPRRAHAQTLERAPFSSGGILAQGWYVVDREIGAGGMATVYVARDVRHDRWVVVKVLRPEIAVTVGVDGFLREIRIAAGLQHPHIVPVFDSGAIDGQLYFVMPLIEGESLRARLEREGALPLGEALRIAREIADALAYAHKHGIVHRDIKPENILLTGDPAAHDSHAMVADFGIARAIAKSGDKELTRTGVVLGSPAYMSPEHAAGDASPDGRSDVYSLACVLYEMLAGKPPFVGAARFAVSANHAEARVPDLLAMRPDVTPQIQVAIERALAAAPADRHPTADAFRRAIQQLASESVPRTAGNFAHSIRNGPTEGRRVRRFAAIAGSAFLMASVAAAAWFGGRALAPPVEGTKAVQEFPKGDIAVLYFEDRSRDHSLQYLADGITEALIAQIQRVPGLTVVSHNGVRPSRRRGDLRADSIAQALKVGTVVRGSVATLGAGVQLTIEVVDAASGRRVAGTQVEQSQPNPIWLQDSLAQAATRLLRARIGDLMPNLTSTPGTRSPTAWDARQLAKGAAWEADSMTKAGNYDEALRKMAYADSMLTIVEAKDRFWTEPIAERARLAYLTARRGGTGWDVVRQIDIGLGNLDRALRNGPNDADALEMRGTLTYLKWLSSRAPNTPAAAALLQSAEKDLVAAVAGPTPRAFAWSVLSHLRLHADNLAGAELAAENAFRLDPFLPFIERTINTLFLASLDRGLRDEAQKWCDVGRARAANDYRFAECRLWMYTLPGGNEVNVSDMWKIYDEYVRLSPGALRKYDTLKGKLIVALALVRAGERDSALALANTNQGDPSMGRGRFADVVNGITTPGLLQLAVAVYSRAGATDSALAVVARSFAADPASLSGRDNRWWVKELRSDPRYQALLRQPRRSSGTAPNE